MVPASFIDPPLQVAAPLTVSVPVPTSCPPPIVSPLIDAPEEREAAPRLMTAKSLKLGGPPPGVQLPAKLQSPVPPNHVYVIAWAGPLELAQASAAANTSGLSALNTV